VDFELFVTFNLAIHFLLNCTAARGTRALLETIISTNTICLAQEKVHFKHVHP